MRYTKYFQGVVYLLVAVLFGCEREIEIDLPQHSSELVIEGWIEQDIGAKVLLSLSAPFFAGIDSNNIRDYAVTQAKVALIGNEQEEYMTLKPNTAYFPPYVYYSTELFGKEGQSYTLIVDFKGKQYTAETTIPKLIRPDSVWFEKITASDTLGLVWLKLLDDANERNYYRIFTRRLGKDRSFVPVFTSTFSDEAFSGDTLVISFSKGNSNLLDISDNRYFDSRDTIIIKCCSIDRAHYDFWNTYQSQIINSANPFSVNNSGISGNIDGAIGVWGGYAAVYDTIFPEF